MLHFFCSYTQIPYKKLSFLCFLLFFYVLSSVFRQPPAASAKPLPAETPADTSAAQPAPTEIPCANHSVSESMPMNINVPIIGHASCSDPVHYYYFSMPGTGTGTLYFKNRSDASFSFQIITADNLVLRQWEMQDGIYSLQGFLKDRYYLVLSLEDASSVSEPLSFQLSCQIARAAPSAHTENSVSGNASQKINKSSFAEKKKNAKTSSLSSIKLRKKKLTLKKGNCYRLKVTLVPDTIKKKSLKWSSSRKKIVSVTQKGKLKAKKSGISKIKVCSKTNKKIFAVCKVKVSAPHTKKTTVQKKSIPSFSPNPQTDKNLKTKKKAAGKKSPAAIKLKHLSLSSSVLRLIPNQTSTLHVVCSPADTTQTKLLWKSVSPFIASISAGKITARKKGITTVIVSSQDNPAISASCTVIVQ